MEATRGFPSASAIVKTGIGARVDRTCSIGRAKAERIGLLKVPKIVAVIIPTERQERIRDFI